MIKLSARLQNLLDRCEPGLPLWDLCCDHGLLGFAAIESGKFSEVILNDAVAHVVEDLDRKLEDSPGRTILALAEQINEPLTGNVVIAGVGGEKIFKILKTHADNGRLHARHLILCPEKHGAWLGDQTLTGYGLKSSFYLRRSGDYARVGSAPFARGGW